MATANSDQIVNALALAAGSGYARDSALNTVNAAVKTSVATYISTALAAGSTIDMLTIPKNARILGGRLITGALGSSVTLGLGTDVALVKEDGTTALTAASGVNILAQTSHAAATVTPVAATRLLGAGGLTTAPTKFTLLTAGATLTAAIEVLLEIDYIQH